MRRGGRIPFLLALAGIPLLLGCSIRLTDPEGFPAAARLHDVKPYSQRPELCGPYALAAVLNFMEIAADPLEMARRLYVPAAGGTLTMDLYLEASRRGLDARQGSGTTQGLVRDLDDGVAPIVLFRYPSLRGSGGHYVVITGYSMAPDGFFLLWGDGRLSWMDADRVEGLWSGSEFWYLILRRKGPW
ncbi:MAG: C39 family peptidase [bacterium]|nr:MAG: C39 family peptidase [bacterium]